MDTAVLQIRNQVTDWLKWEMDDRFSRDNVVIAAGQTLANGTVVGRIGAGSAHVGGLPQNVGNGVMGPVTVPVGTAPGVYKVNLLTGGPTGTFEVLDPEGNVAGTGAVGTAYTAGLGFTLADGATDFAVGDGFRISVDDGGGTVAIFDPGASNGTQNPVGIVTDSYDTTDGLATPGAIVTRDAHIINFGLKWKAGITAAQKAAALAALATKNVLVLREA